MVVYLFAGIVIGLTVGSIGTFIVRMRFEKAEYERGLVDGRSVNVTQIVSKKNVIPELVKASVSFMKEEIAECPEYCEEITKKRLSELFGRRAVEMASFKQSDDSQYGIVLITGCLYMAKCDEWW